MADSRINADWRRRDVFRLAAITGVAFWSESYAFAASGFWNKKKLSEWTEQELQELRTKSPWAKKIDAELSGGGGHGAGGGGGGGGVGNAESSGGGGRGGGGGGGGGGRGGGGGGGGAASGGGGGGGTSTASLEVVWQSAKPILDAHKIDLPAALDNHYVIAVTGIPMPTLVAIVMGRSGGRGGSGGRSGGRGGNGGRGGGRDGGGGGGRDGANAAPGADGSGRGDGGPPAAPPDPALALERGSTLNVKGKTPQNADVVRQTNGGATLLFGFAKETLALTVADKEVDFELKLGALAGKAKFSLKEMMYNGELAL